MAHFAYVVDGVVQRVEPVANPVTHDEDGIEYEELGQEHLSRCHGVDPVFFVQTHYPNGQDPHPRGKYACIGDLWDGTDFVSPQ